jgi:hypothetical protein
MERFQKYLPLATFVLVFFLFFKSCGTSSKVSKLEKQNEKLMVMLDSMYHNTAKTSELKPILENTVLWRTLEIEELSDKNKMPINHYKNEEK